MNLHEAQRICNQIDSKYALSIKSVKWNEVFGSEEEMLEALKRIYIPKNRTAPFYTFKGYAYIYSFAYYVQKGWKLSENQLRQCKRLAVEIKKASAIAEYIF